MLYFIIYPLVMAVNMQENAVFILEFSKISLPWEPPPLLGRFAPTPPPVEKPWLRQ